MGWTAAVAEAAAAAAAAPLPPDAAAAAQARKALGKAKPMELRCAVWSVGAFSSAGRMRDSQLKFQFSENKRRIVFDYDPKFDRDGPMPWRRPGADSNPFGYMEEMLVRRRLTHADALAPHHAMPDA